MKYCTLNFIKIGSKRDRIVADTLINDWAHVKEVGAKSKWSMSKTRCSLQKILKKLLVYLVDGIKLLDYSYARWL